MDVTARARELDSSIEQVVRRMGGRDFMRLGRWMDEFTNRDRPLWALLTNPKTNKLYDSQEQWISVRLRSQRATAFSARALYRQLKGKVPEDVMDKSEPGALKVLAQLPESAQKSEEIQDLISTSTTGEFVREALTRYPEELVEKTLRWMLSPTISQASLYDRVLEKIQDYYRKTADESLTRESALEYILKDAEESIDQEA
jgi:hypothetical protein